MVELRRHRLVRLGTPGWAELQGRKWHNESGNESGSQSGSESDSEWDPEARACLAHWAANHLPLVVTRQPEALPAGVVALGLSAPVKWGRRRIALQVPMHRVLYFDDFPPAAALAAQLPRSARESWLQLCAALARLGVLARVYGSHGWQHLTGLGHVQADSDIDLRLCVDGPRMADAAVALLSGSPLRRPRLDGELAFPDGREVAWREWQQWRCGQVERVLVKRVDAVALVDDAAWLDPRLEAHRR